jgi:hypothetical protein
MSIIKNNLKIYKIYNDIVIYRMDIISSQELAVLMMFYIEYCNMDDVARKLDISLTQVDEILSKFHNIILNKCPILNNYILNIYPQVQLLYLCGLYLCV